MDIEKEVNVRFSFCADKYQGVQNYIKNNVGEGNDIFTTLLFFTMLKKYTDDNYNNIVKHIYEQKGMNEEIGDEMLRLLNKSVHNMM